MNRTLEVEGSIPFSSMFLKVFFCRARLGNSNLALYCVFGMKRKEISRELLIGVEQLNQGKLSTFDESAAKRIKKKGRRILASKQMIDGFRRNVDGIPID